MKRFIFLIVIVSFISLLSACLDESNASNPAIKIDEWDIKQNELGVKHFAYNNWSDTLRDLTTYKVQKEFINQIVLFKDYTLEDAYEKNGELIAKFDSYDGYLLILSTPIDSIIAQKLLSKDYKYEYFGVVTMVKKVTVPDIQLNPKTDGEFESIEVSTDTVKLIYGELVDFVLND